MKRFVFMTLLTFLSIPVSTVALAKTIDVLIKGIDDGIKSTKQRDYKEALMNAKQQAIERAGIDIRSITQVEDGRLKYDMIESMAKAVLQPGFQVMDIGYIADGTYQVVLSGKVRVGKKKPVEESTYRKQLRYAKNLMKNNKREEAEKVIDPILKKFKGAVRKGKHHNIDDDIVAETVYCSAIWFHARHIHEIYIALKSFFPDSKYVHLLEAHIKKLGKEIGRVGDFISYDKGTVLDTETGLMWAAKDNGEDVNWRDAKRYCENYVGSGYVDWRLPTVKELSSIYNQTYGLRGKLQKLKRGLEKTRLKKEKKTEKEKRIDDLLWILSDEAQVEKLERLFKLFGITGCCLWASKTGGNEATFFDFAKGNVSWGQQSHSHNFRVLPVRLSYTP